METSNIDRDQLKNVLKEILEENPNYFKKILAEILEEKKSRSEDRTAKIRGFIEEDFDKYDDVFKALA